MHERMEPILSQAALFCCPLCHGAITRGDTFLRCERGHTFSLSKKGYVDFVPGARAGAYDGALFESRQRFIAGGFYAQMLQTLLGLIAQYAPTGPLLDAGCGEGSFLKALMPDPSVRPCLGLDLSRPGIQQAANGGGGWLWGVGDLARLPLQDGSIGAMVNILSPANYPEFARVLGDKGVLFKVVPGDGYLREVRALIQGQLRRNSYSSRQVQSLFAQRFRLLYKEEIQKTLPLSFEQARDLIAMTPLTQGIEKERLPLTALREITIHLHILVGRRP